MKKRMDLEHEESQRLERVRKVEVLISTLLRVGVVVSLSFVVFGTIVTFMHHPEYLHSRQAMERLTHPGARFPSTVGAVMAGVLNLEGRSIVVLGLLLLIATPVLRVAVSTLIFLHQRDLSFTLITLVVLSLLLLSFVLGKAGG